MVMDDGPFPSGRIRVYETQDRFHPYVSHYDGYASTDDDDTVPNCFIGTEYIQMRNGELMPVVKHAANKERRIIFDAASMEYTDIGYISKWYPDHPNGIFRYNVVGDVVAVDWDRVLSADAGCVQQALCAMVRDCGEKHNNGQDKDKWLAFRHGFLSSIQSVIWHFSWNDPDKRAVHDKMFRWKEEHHE
eukprot:gene17256-23576_t